MKVGTAVHWSMDQNQNNADQHLDHGGSLVTSHVGLELQHRERELGFRHAPGGTKEKETSQFAAAQPEWLKKGNRGGA